MMENRKSDCADEFYALCRILDKTLFSQLEREIQFKSDRKYRFDFAIKKYFIAIEIDGGRWCAGGGRHASCADYRKLNEAACLGWRVLRFTSKMVKETPFEIIDTIKKLIRHLDV
jgi:very-short-patch-repair endonuclease